MEELPLLHNPGIFLVILRTITSKESEMITSITTCMAWLKSNLLKKYLFSLEFTKKEFKILKIKGWYWYTGRKQCFLSADEQMWFTFQRNSLCLIRYRLLVKRPEKITATDLCTNLSILYALPHFIFLCSHNNPNASISIL